MRNATLPAVTGRTCDHIRSRVDCRTRRANEMPRRANISRDPRCSAMRIDRRAGILGVMVGGSLHTLPCVFLPQRTHRLSHETEGERDQAGEAVGRQWPQRLCSPCRTRRSTSRSMRRITRRWHSRCVDPDITGQHEGARISRPIDPYCRQAR